jgi:DNA-binding NtrC family response regulator
VDDESSLRKVLTDLLRLRGYDPLQAASGEEALKLMAVQPFAIAIIDISLKEGGGEMDGIDLLRRVKAEYPTTECVILTGLPSQQTAIEAVSAGAFGYLVKPFNVTELVGTLERALARRRENEDLVQAQRRAHTVDAARLRMVGRLRADCISALHRLDKLGQNIAAGSSLADTQAFGQEVQKEAQGVLDVLAAIIAEAEADPEPR